jgi:hypothetical protein
MPNILTIRSLGQLPLSVSASILENPRGVPWRSARLTPSVRRGISSRGFFQLFPVQEFLPPMPGTPGLTPDHTGLLDKASD